MPWALFQYTASRKLERAEWFTRLYEKFFEHERLKAVRDVIDEANSLESEVLAEMVASESAAFTDYLNFFEYVAYLVSRGILSSDEVEQLFGYYLTNIRRSPLVWSYVANPEHGYELLRRLLDRGVAR